MAGDEPLESLLMRRTVRHRAHEAQRTGRQLTRVDHAQPVLKLGSKHAKLAACGEGTSPMPSSHINDPEHWRARAAEARAVAEHMPDPEARQTMLSIAADYEKLAKRAEDRAAGRSPQSK